MSVALVDCMNGVADSTAVACKLTSIAASAVVDCTSGIAVSTVVAVTSGVANSTVVACTSAADECDGEWTAVSALYCILTGFL